MGDRTKTHAKEAEKQKDPERKNSNVNKSLSVPH